MNWVYKSLSKSLISVIWDVYSEVGLIDPASNSLKKFFLRNCHTAFHSACTIYIPGNSAQRFQFLHILINTCFFLFR